MPRVRISQNGLVIAQPGFDVDTAFGTQLHFNSKCSQMGIYMKGTAALVFATTNLGSDSGFICYGQVTVPFGRTFYTPPLVELTGNYEYYIDNQTPRKAIAGIVMSYGGTVQSTTTVNPMILWTVTTTGFTAYAYHGRAMVPTTPPYPYGDQKCLVNSINYVVMEQSIQ